MTTNNPTPNPQISDIIKLVNLGEESILVAKFQQQVPDGTKIKSIEVILDTPGGGAPSNNCGIQFN
jgi:hypothetical protein